MSNMPREEPIREKRVIAFRDLLHEIDVLHTPAHSAYPLLEVKLKGESVRFLPIVSVRMVNAVVILQSHQNRPVPKVERIRDTASVNKWG